MRRIPSILVLLLAVAGCGRKTPPPADLGSGPGAGQLTPAEDNANWEAAPAPGTTYQGQTAPQWAKQLQSDNHSVRSRASIALADMGKAGYPYLLEGMRSRSDAVRVASIQAISKPSLLENGSDTLPLLIRMLRDPEPMLRRSAAARLCWFGTGAQGALRDLRYMAENDPVPDIRQVAQVSIELILNPKVDPSRGTDPFPKK